MGTMRMLKDHEKIAALEMTVCSLNDDLDQARLDLRRMQGEVNILSDALYSLVKQMVDQGKVNELLVHPNESIRDVAANVASREWIQRRKWDTSHDGN